MDLLNNTKSNKDNLQERGDNDMYNDTLEIRNVESLSFIEMKEIISKVWLNVDDIMKLAHCGKHSTTNIRNEIEGQVVSSGKKLPTGMYKCVPTKLVLDYLGLDVDYILNMAERLA